MITPVLPIAVLAAASLASPQPTAIHALLPSAPIFMQVTDIPVANAQVKASDPKVRVGVPSTNPDDLFAGTEKFAQGASESTEINLDPDSMEMAGEKHKTAKKMKTMVIRSYKYDKPGMYKMDDIEVYRKKLEDGSWKCSVRVREKNGSSTDICSRLGPDHETREMVILTAEPKEVTFIHMSGQMSLDELGNAAHGLEHR